MTGYDTRRCQMFRRVGEFERMYRDRFPSSSSAHAAFAVVAKAVTDIDMLAARKRASREHGWRRKRIARDALLARTAAIVRTAADIGKRIPGADGRFPRLQRRGDVDVLQHGRMIVASATKSKDMFITHGMPERFIDDLQAAVDAFEATMHGGWAKKTSTVVCRVGTREALDQGLQAVQTLDVVIANAFAGDLAVLTTWKEMRRTDRLEPASAA